MACKTDEELQKKAAAGAAALHKAFSGPGTDESAVVGVLQQEPAIVRAVHTEYDANHNTHYRQGLVYDLQQEFTGVFESASTWNLITALLQRAGITPPKGAEQHFVHQGAADTSGMSIVATPQQKVVAPGTSVEYRVKQPDSVSDLASRWTYQWYRLNETSAAADAGRDTYETGPTTANWGTGQSNPFPADSSAARQRGDCGLYLVDNASYRRARLDQAPAELSGDLIGARIGAPVRARRTHGQLPSM